MSAESMVDLAKIAALILGSAGIAYVAIAGLLWRLPEIISALDRLLRTIGDLIHERAERKRVDHARRRNAPSRSLNSRARRSTHEA
jgi:hypothetical protein